MNKSMDILSIENLSFSYDKKERVILKDITLSIREGESLALIGPSGAGKSTLLKVLQEKTPEASFIHQELLLVPQLSLFHNVYMGKLDSFPTWYNILNLIFPQKREKNAVHTLAEKLHIAHLIKKPCKKLSGGEQQRTAIARALFRGAPLCFADEPVSAMDPKNARHSLSLLHEHATVVASMHNTQLALATFDRVLGLKDGRILFNLAADNVTENHLAMLYSR